MMAKTSKSKTKLSSITIRSYQVGFGDCFLLSFHYASGARSRHVLIDFGTTGAPKGSTKASTLQQKVAQHIEAVCEGKLDVVVATHRHKDHISGFDDSGGATSSGAIIASLRPSLVIQPWTEDPAAKIDALKPTKVLPKDKKNLDQIRALLSMESVAVAALAASQNESGILKKRLAFLGENAISNKDAVKNLMSMGKNRYIYFGAKSGLERLLPGVKVSVLGPPTLSQTDSIRKQKHTDLGEFWHLQAATLKSSSKRKDPFPDAERYASPPPNLRWFTKRMESLTKDSLLELVTILDSALNNTSVILLFEVQGKKFLFPGDAQIENWSYALMDSKENAAIRSSLKDVDFYKVGHHGSLNATPKTLWKLFIKKSAKKSDIRLRTNVSTMAGKHGSVDDDTEVPRRPLVETLKQESNYFSTQELASNQNVWKWTPADGIEAAKFCHVETFEF